VNMKNWILYIININEFDKNKINFRSSCFTK
jgi:hypothetical protein